MSALAPIADDELAGLFDWLEPFFPLTLAVSGGGDSIALMLLLSRWAGLERTGGGAQSRTPARQPSSLVQNIAVVTVDHGLRSESAEEAVLVRRQAEALGFFHETLVWTGTKPQTGLQAAARDARYRLMLAFHERHWRQGGSAGGGSLEEPGASPAVAKTPPTGALVTAHHQDDQGETVLMRLARGSGVDGLAAMAMKSKVHGLDLLRPLLRVEKARLRATVQASGVAFIDDPSNRNADFERVRLRRARAGLEAAGLHNRKLALSAMRALRARDALEVATTELSRRAGLEFLDLGYVRLDHDVFCNASEELRIRLLGRLLALVAGRARFGDRAGSGEPARPPRLSKLEDMSARLAAHADGACFAGATLAGCSLSIRDGAILVFREAGRLGLPDASIEPGQRLLWDGRFEVSVDRRFASPLRIAALGLRGWTLLKAKFPAVAVHAIPAAAAAVLPVFRPAAEPATAHGDASTIETETLPLAVPSLAAYEGKLAGPAIDGRPLLQAHLRHSGSDGI